MKQKLTLILIITAFCFFKIESLKAQVNIKDSLALVDLYNSTDGLHWYDHTNWLTTAPVTTWFGVTVSKQRVTKLNFESNRLHGSLPSSIGNLTNLIELRFRFNENLSGSIPSEIGNLTKLVNLGFGNCGITGSLPTSIGNLISLKHIDLSLNKITGVLPTTMGNLKNLRDLYIGFNKFSGGIPSTFSNLINLSYFEANDCTLSGDLSFISGLIRLRRIVLSRNNLTGSIPSTINNVKNLNSCFLDNNQLTGEIPASLGKLNFIEELALSNNKLSGSIPSSLTNLDKASIFWIDRNHFTFNGLETLVLGVPYVACSPQATIHLSENGNKLSVSAGGTLSNNTYKWYKDGKLINTKVGDSTLTVNGNSAYYVIVSNSIVTELLLYSDTVYHKPSLNSIASQDLVVNKPISLSIYPNPTKSIATISCNVSKNCTIKITDVSGCLLQTVVIPEGSHSLSLDVSKYAKGIYFVSLIDDNKYTQTLKLIKE